MIPLDFGPLPKDFIWGRPTTERSRRASGGHALLSRKGTEALQPGAGPQTLEDFSGPGSQRFRLVLTAACNQPLRVLGEGDSEVERGAEVAKPGLGSFES